MSTSDKILSLRHEALTLRKEARAKFIAAEKLATGLERDRASVLIREAEGLNKMAEARDGEASRLADIYFGTSAPTRARKLSFKRERDDVGGGYGRSDY